MSGSSLVAYPRRVHSRAGRAWLDGSAKVFVQQMKLRASYFKTPNVLVPFGDDFKFQNPEVQFQNMDLLMEYINANTDKFGIHMRYGTVGQYIDAVKATKTEWPLYEGDFFPYAFAPDGMWESRLVLVVSSRLTRA